MAKPPHISAEMRVFYLVFQRQELAAGYRYTTKNKGFKEERKTKVGLDAIGKSTPLESNKSLAGLQSD
jgi:hypothetical protein